VTDRFNRYSRPDDLFAGGRTIALSMTTPQNEISGYSLANPLHTGAWAPPVDAASVAESPAHHRYPVHWNGDFTSMNNDIEMMVDAGVHDLKPYVHPDCGGDGWFRSVGSLLRQTQMCSFGTILRYHGGPHQPWIYGGWWEGVIKKYIVYRYKMMPMIIAAGYRAHKDGWPLVARGDLYWPGVGHSNDNHQYIFLDDILVAPIWDAANNSKRGIWIPPGKWMDVWNGVVTAGPTSVDSWQPWERQPMWVRMDGGLLIMTDSPGLRVAEGDWSTLTVEAYPCQGKCTTTRKIYERSDEIDATPSTTEVTLTTDGSEVIEIHLGANTDGLARAWTVRVNLIAGEEVISATLDGMPVTATTLYPRASDDGTPWQGYWPWKGKDSIPASKAGPVAQVSVPSSTVSHTVRVTVAKSVGACSWDGDDCRDTSCCKVTGSKCFAKSDFWATCMQDCTPGVHATSVDGKPWSCEVLGMKPATYASKPAPMANMTAGTSLFCFSVHMALETWQQAVRAAQQENGYGIHACDLSKVYMGSSTPEGILSGVTTIPKTFIEIWEEVRTDGMYRDYDWTVKVDVDAVFLPPRLTQHLTLLRPLAGASLYIKNSETYGIASPLIVVSTEALTTYFENQEDCAHALGNYGEDFYFAACLDALGVGHMNDYKMIKNFEDAPVENTQVCQQTPYAAFYPYKRAETWTSCYEQAGSAVIRTIGTYEVPAIAAKFDSYSRLPTVFLSGGGVSLGAATAAGALLAAAALVAGFFFGAQRRRSSAAQRRRADGNRVPPPEGRLLPQEDLIADNE
jgi:hypothetical protein